MIRETENYIKKKVYEDWRGRCGFCGIKLPLEEHHIIAKSKDPSLINTPENLILVCSNHHALTLKTKADGKFMLSFEDVSDLINSKYKNSTKRGGNVVLPDENVPVIIGLNKFENCKYIIAVNQKPLLETTFKKPVTYATKKTFLLFIRLFDKNNNFIGGLFGDYWASTTGGNCKLNLKENSILAECEEDIWIKITICPSFVHIEGILYFDGIKIAMNQDNISLNNQMKIQGLNFKNNECALRVYGSQLNASYKINGSLDD